MFYAKLGQYQAASFNRNPKQKLMFLLFCSLPFCFIKRYQANYVLYNVFITQTLSLTNDKMLF